MRLESCTSNQELLCGRLIWVWDPNAARPGSIGILNAARFYVGPRSAARRAPAQSGRRAHI